MQTDNTQQSPAAGRSPDWQQYGEAVTAYHEAIAFGHFGVAAEAAYRSARYCPCREELPRWLQLAREARVRSLPWWRAIFASALPRREVA
jgi:hypothetical protein